MSGKWNGPECFMCKGTGIHHVSREDSFTRDSPFARYVRDVPTNLPCPSCNGHGRQPSDEQVVE